MLKELGKALGDAKKVKSEPRGLKRTGNIDKNTRKDAEESKTSIGDY